MSFILDMAKQAAEAVLKPFMPAANTAVQSALVQSRSYISVVSEKAQQIPQVQKAAMAAETVTKSQLATIAAVGAVTAGTIGVAALIRRRKAPKKKAAKIAPKKKAPMKKTVKQTKKKAPKKKTVKQTKKKALQKRKQEPHKGSEKKHSRIKGELVHYTEKGQPYIIEMRTIKGKQRRMARFIKKEGVKKHGK